MRARVASSYTRVHRDASRIKVAFANHLDDAGNRIYRPATRLRASRYGGAGPRNASPAVGSVRLQSDR